MGTWISHLRIADKLMERSVDIDPVAFTFGSLAPDSGVPDEDGSSYDPPKEITHFMEQGSDEYFVSDLVFYRQYLMPCDRYTESSKYSFLLGYFFHLITDRLWAERIGRASRNAFPDLFSTQSEIDAWNTIKPDWYDLDHLYLRQNPDFRIWQIYLTAPIPQIPLPFLSQPGYESQVNFIREFYANPLPENDLERSYPYMNETTMRRFVEDSAVSLQRIRRMLTVCPLPQSLKSAISFLPSAETAPMPLPLGD